MVSSIGEAIGNVKRDLSKMVGRDRARTPGANQKAVDEAEAAAPVGHIEAADPRLNHTIPEFKSVNADWPDLQE